MGGEIIYHIYIYTYTGGLLYYAFFELAVAQKSEIQPRNVLIFADVYLAPPLFNDFHSFWTKKLQRFALAGDPTTNKDVKHSLLV